MSLDTAQLLLDLQNAASTSLQADVTTFQGFTQQQLQGIADQSKLVAEGILTGEITEATRDFFLQGLKDLTINFAKTLMGLATVSIEKSVECDGQGGVGGAFESNRLSANTWLNLINKHLHLLALNLIA